MLVFCGTSVCYREAVKEQMNKDATLSIYLKKPLLRNPATNNTDQLYRAVRAHHWFSRSFADMLCGLNCTYLPLEEVTNSLLKYRALMA